MRLNKQWETIKNRAAEDVKRYCCRRPAATNDGSFLPACDWLPVFLLTTGTSANNSGGSKLAFLVVPHGDSVVEVGVVGHMAGDGSIIAENGSFN